MDARVAKLVKAGLSADTARKLVNAGLATPALIRVAKPQELDAAGVDVKDVAAVRGKGG